MTNDYTKHRNALVNQIAKEVQDKRVLQAMRKVPRHLFVSPKLRCHAYEDYPLSIGKNQTISQPSLIAFMTQRLKLNGDDMVLEIGTGSGYQAAILSHLCKKVITIERIESLAIHARKLLKRLDYSNLNILCLDGMKGVSKFAPYQAILLSACAKEIPKVLIDQLDQKGRIIFPMEKRGRGQLLMYGIKKNNKMEYKELFPVAFVPIVRGTS